MAPIEILKAVSGPRWRIAWFLFKSDSKSVTEIANSLDMYRDYLSRQLNIMKKAGVVKCEKVGKEKYYHLTNGNAFTHFNIDLRKLGEEE